MSKMQSTTLAESDDDCDEDCDNHTMMPDTITYTEYAELEFIGIQFYDDGVGNTWAISHTDQEYDEVQKVLEAHE